MIWIGVAVVVCLVSFWLGRFSRPPAYDMEPLAIDRALLATLRDGHSTNAIGLLEGKLDLETLDAMRHRPSLQSRDCEILDRILVKVARYREQYPRAIDTSTNGFGNPIQLQQYEGWIAEQKQIDAFLHDFAKQSP